VSSRRHRNLSSDRLAKIILKRGEGGGDAGVFPRKGRGDPTMREKFTIL